jgi:hypothetical protein
MADDLDDLFDAVRRFMVRRYPGEAIRSLTLRLQSGERVVLPRSIRCVVAEAEPRRPQTNQTAHSPDFRSVNYHGHLFRFSATQAPVVKMLWEAHGNGAPDVGQQLLLEEAGSTCNRLLDLFKRSPAWGSLIVAGEERGTFRLATRDELEQAMAQRDSETDMA